MTDKAMTSDRFSRRMEQLGQRMCDFGENRDDVADLCERLPDDIIGSTDGKDPILSALNSAIAAGKTKFGSIAEGKAAVLQRLRTASWLHSSCYRDAEGGSSDG